MPCPFDYLWPPRCALTLPKALNPTTKHIECMRFTMYAIVPTQRAVRMQVNFGLSHLPRPELTSGFTEAEHNRVQQGRLARAIRARDTCPRNDVIDDSFSFSLVLMACDAVITGGGGGGASRTSGNFQCLDRPQSQECVLSLS